MATIRDHSSDSGVYRIDGINGGRLVVAPSMEEAISTYMDEMRSRDRHGAVPAEPVSVERVGAVFAMTGQKAK